MEKRTVLHLFYLFSAILLLFLLLVFYIRLNNRPSEHLEKAEKECTDLEHILERNRLDVSLGYNSLNYYILHGRPVGFQYELAKYFADYLNVELSIIVTNDIREAVNMLRNGKCDIVCADLTISEGRFGDDIVFTLPYAYTSQLLIQQKRENPDEMVSSVEDLAGKTVYIPSGSVFKSILKTEIAHLSHPPVIIEVKYYGSEHLIDAVADGIIGYTIADQHLASYHAYIYDNLDISLEIGGDKPMGWCMRKGSEHLLEAFDSWLYNFCGSREYGYLYHRFYENPWKFSKTSDGYFSAKQETISAYDDVIKKHSGEIGWDWRLIAALIYEESHFRHDLVSYAGAFGIMQLMPVTAAKFGVGPESSAEEHIKAGIKLIQFLDDSFIEAVPDSIERKKFVLAAYNLGEGHIRDAMALADKYNKNPRLWENNVEYYLIAKSQHRYFTDEVVDYGYCKGQATAGFVKSILERYEHYKNMFP